MAAALVPFHPPPPAAFRWSQNASIQLIRERRNLHQQFERLANNHHDDAWTLIANRVFVATGFVATSRQCRVKWHALKRGYENLTRIRNGNDDDFPITSLNSFDRACFQEMNDEFWLQTGNYLSNLYHNLLQLLTLFIGFKMCLGGTIGGKMPLMIGVDMNIDTDHDPQEGKEGKGDDVLDQEVEVEVEIGHVLQTEIEEDDPEVEEDIDIF